ncbi:MAG: MFS transporter [Pseudomonadota bacterium]
MEANTRKRIWGWMAFDWATQPFYTLGLTFIFGPYFADVAQTLFLSEGLAPNEAKAKAQSVWSWGQMFAGLFIAFLAPIIGAYADSTGRRMPWLIFFSIIYAVSVWMLWYMSPDGAALWFCLFAFCIAFVAAEFALIFTNALLPSLGTQDEIGKISGDGAALGYWGGLLSLVIMLLFFFELDEGRTILGNAPPFGLNGEAREGTRAVGPFITIWFVIFMIPYFLYVRDNATPNRQGGLKSAINDLKTSLKNVVKRPSLFAFLGSSMLYRDALNALYAFGGVYAVLVLDWTLIQIAIFGILGVVTAAIGTTVSGRYDRKLGPRPVITFHVLVLVLVSLTIVATSRTSFYGIALPQGSSIPDLTLYICGALIGSSGGGLYAASRSMMVRHTHPERPTEAFGLFALSGKATAFLAPMLIGLFTTVLQDARLGFAPVILLFLAGLFLLRWVEPEGDHQTWSKEAIPAP